MRFATFAVVALLVACERAPQQRVPAPAQAQSIYERYAALERDPAFQAKLASATQHTQELAWMADDWSVVITVYATAASPERRENVVTHFRVTPSGQIVSDDLSTLLVYDAFEGHWRTAGSEPPIAPLNMQSASAPWNGRTLVFEGDIHALGEAFVLRQTMTKLSDDEFDILNEQRAGSRYVRVDDYHFTRVQPR